MILIMSFSSKVSGREFGIKGKGGGPVICV